MTTVRSPHVLVVEDELLVRMSTVATFEDLGCEVLEAASTDDAMAILNLNPSLRLLFTDIQLPGTVDGLELARMVRRQWPNICIVLSSGRVLRPEASLPDGVRFIAKPYYQHDLEDIATT